MTLKDSTTRNQPLKTNSCETRLSWLARYRSPICRLVPVIAIICFIAWCVLTLKPHFSWDDAEPEILDQAWRLARGESIYRGIEAPPYAIPIYPPLYLAIVASIMKLTGLSYLPAKLLSFLAGISIGWALIRLGKEWNGNRLGGLWSAFFLFVIPAFVYNVVRCHVQMTAVALSVWSFVFFQRNRWRESFVLSPLLAALAFYTKQTQVALPLAMCLYLLFLKRRCLAPYILMLAAAILIPFFLFQKATGGHFYMDTVYWAGLSYNALTIPQIFLHHAGPVLVFLALALSSLCRRIRLHTMEPIDFYFPCVLITTLISLGRIGAHGQYVVELVVVTLIYLLRTADVPFIRGRNVWVSIQVLIVGVYAPFFVFVEEGSWARAANAASGAIYETIRKDPGPILSQQGSFALFGRGEIYMQLFHFSSLSRAGKWDQTHVIQDIAARKFPYVITEFRIEIPAKTESDSERFTPEMLLALRANYRCSRSVYPYFVYTPLR